MDLFRPRREPIDLPPQLESIVHDALRLENRMRSLSKDLAFRGHLPPEPIGELIVAANQVKCARLFLADSLKTLRDAARADALPDDHVSQEKA